MLKPDQVRAYRRARHDHLMMPAKTAYAIATAPDYSADWEESGGHDSRWTREVDGFTIRLDVMEESIYPNPNRAGETDYGRYVDEARDDWSGEWGGNHPRPAESAPLGIPYTSIRYSGPGWTQGEGSGYFIPDGIEETYASFRACGQSRSVAWDLTRADVEAQISMLFSSPLTYVHVRVTASREGIELASESMGTDVSGDAEGRAYVFTMVEEYGMVDDVVERAHEVIERLTAAA